MSETFTLACRQLRRHPQRSLAQVVGITLMIALLVLWALVLLSTGREKERLLQRLGTDGILYVPLPWQDGRPASDTKNPLDPGNEGFYIEPSVAKLLPISRVADVRAFPEVEFILPCLQFRFRDTKDYLLYNVGAIDTQATGAFSFFGLSGSDMLSGTTLHEGDRGVVLVSEPLALDRRWKLGALANVAGVVFPMIGIFKTGIRPLSADIYMPWADAERVINRRLSAPLASEASALLVRVKQPSFWPAVKQRLESVFPGCVIDTQQEAVPVVQAQGVQRRGTISLLVLAALFVGLLCWRHQWAVTRERRGDLGILKALGWNDRVLSRQVFYEALIPALIGGTWGGSLGLLLAAWPGFGRLLGTTVGLDGATELIVLVGGVGCSLGGGLIAGFWSAGQAAGVAPVVFLRSEKR
jgi:hypothetical protein